MKVHLGDSGAPLLDQFSEEGFVNCIFSISSHTKTDQGHKLHLSAEHRGELVGFDAVVQGGIRGGLDSDMGLIQYHVYPEGVQFRRSGPESDRLIQALAALYGLPQRPERMVDAFDFTVIGLFKDGEADADADPVRLKLFGNDDECDEEDYFESFLYLDLGAGFAAWNEKDPDYRKPLIKSISR